MRTAIGAITPSGRSDALAGLAVGFWQSTDEVRALRVSDRVFSPERAQAECDEKYRLWKRAVSCACGWIEKA